MLMNPAELRAEVAAVFAQALKIEVPSYDTDLFATGLLDSLGFVDLLLELERHFGVRVEIESIEPANFSCIGNIADFIVGQRKFFDADERGLRYRGVEQSAGRPDPSAVPAPRPA